MIWTLVALKWWQHEVVVERVVDLRLLVPHRDPLHTRRPDRALSFKGPMSNPPQSLLRLLFTEDMGMGTTPCPV